MNYSFNYSLIKEQGRTFIEIPFNVWETLGIKGNIPVSVNINSVSFECKLLPKGQGKYYIPVKKDIALKIDESGEVSFEVIQSLTRINNNSPYSNENPIRKIDCINEMDVKPGLCGQTCIAMLAGIEVGEVVKLMGRQISWSKIIEALDYYGIKHSGKMVYPKRKNVAYPQCFIAYVNGEFVLYYLDRFYGKSADISEVTSFMEIVL
ncbi:MAG: DUF1905 domain-containing protein [Candidatus Coproplasma sp.]